MKNTRSAIVLIPLLRPSSLHQLLFPSGLFLFSWVRQRRKSRPHTTYCSPLRRRGVSIHCKTRAEVIRLSSLITQIRQKVEQDEELCRLYNYTEIYLNEVWSGDLVKTLIWHFFFFFRKLNYIVNEMMLCWSHWSVFYYWTSSESPVYSSASAWCLELYWGSCQHQPPITSREKSHSVLSLLWPQITHR